MSEILLRFLMGGAVVSVFALLGDLFKPKSFAGLFGAAPSVALVTLALTLSTEGARYVATMPLLRTLRLPTRLLLPRHLAPLQILVRSRQSFTSKTKFMSNLLRRPKRSPSQHKTAWGMQRVAQN